MCYNRCGRRKLKNHQHNDMDEEEEAPQFIHGCLHATIFEADNLHHSVHGFALLALEKTEKALHLDEFPHSKLYATIDFGIARLARTREVEFHPKNPKWNQSFHIYCAHTSREITISIKNQLPVSAEVLGRAKIPISQILTGQPIEGWFDLFNDEGHKLHEANIHILLHFSDVKSDPCWNSGIKVPIFSGNLNSYFPQRTGCNVTLYQNSHLSNDFNPNILLPDNEFYDPPRLWEDLYNAISDAKHFIYVAGWSVNTDITLVRDPNRMIPGAENVTIGELLKRKADEGVIVLVMVWQDRTSLSLLGNAGLMKTHDEETWKFFENTKVKCFLCPRNPDSSLTVVQHIEIGTEFTHHQKTVTLDGPIAGDNSDRQVVSFIGGIDLSDGRYDNEKHPLFRNLDTIYLNDFQQKNFPHANLQQGGPREPWHDVHSKIEGLAAWDVLINFEQRWTKQAPKEISGCLLNIRENPEIVWQSANFEESESWNVQVFRSIDDSSVIGFPSDPSKAAMMGLMSGKDVTIDQSIQSGYIQAIRRAKRFIFIENQYFFGSCYAWSEDQDSGCLNLVPIEIAMKIASKIRAGERFATYVVTPMWPEGEPESDTVQAILHWNGLTMEMMYKIIAGAIEEMGLGGEVHPTDYLSFFCLANREVQYPDEYTPPQRPEPETNYWNAQVNRRFLIYVHAKLMIVDDEYVIMGSANLNQRSLEGGRDTEIAYGAYQPQHVNESEGRAGGVVYGYRMSLWYEHFMSHHTHRMHIFAEAESLECMRSVKQIAGSLWEKYIRDEVVDLPGHLLPFPVTVLEDGTLSELPENGLFPDTKASVKGKKSEVLPPILTT